jgi:peptidoglycan/xylan/chitin deacetylase (PgdA/CDA1 family)
MTPYTLGGLRLTRLLPGTVWLYPAPVCRLPILSPALYLTYDDGPEPGATSGVLGLLDKASAHATFFCLGCQAVRHPQLLLDIQRAGHVVGSHTYSHPDGVKTTPAAYLADAIRGIQVLENILGSPPTLFRPPYGRPNPCLQTLTAEYCQQVVLWTHILYDWDARQPITQTIRYIKSYVRAGDIVVLHDSLKAQPRVLELTQALITHAHSNNWALLPLP